MQGKILKLSCNRPSICFVWEELWSPPFKDSQIGTHNSCFALSHLRKALRWESGQSTRGSHRACQHPAHCGRCPQGVRGSASLLPSPQITSVTYRRGAITTLAFSLSPTPHGGGIHSNASGHQHSSPSSGSSL